MSINIPQLGMPAMPQLGMPQPQLGMPQPQLGMPQPQLGMPQPQLGMPQFGGPTNLPQEDFAESLSKTLSKTILEQATARIRDQLTSFANIVCAFPEAAAKGITPQYILDVWNSVAPELAISASAPVQTVSGSTCAAKLLKGGNSGQTCKNKPMAGSLYCSRHKDRTVPPMALPQAAPGAPPQGMGVMPPGIPPQGILGIPPGIPQLSVPAAPPQIAPQAAPQVGGQTCTVLLKSGPRKDQQCGGKLVAGGTTCSRHAAKSAAPAVPQMGVGAMPAIGVPAANLPQFGAPVGIPMLVVPPQ